MSHRKMHSERQPETQKSERRRPAAAQITQNLTTAFRRVSFV